MQANLIIKDEKDTVRVSWEHLSQSDGRVCDEGAKRKLAEHGIGCKGKTARQMTRRDYDRFDLLIGMDSANIRNMYRICGGDPEQKIHELLDFTDRIGDVADPWYTGDFEATWRDVLEGCQCMLEQLM